MSDKIPVTKIWEWHYSLFQKYHPLNSQTDFAQYLKEEFIIFDNIYDEDTKKWRANYHDCEPIVRTISWLYVILKDWPEAIDFYGRLETHPDYAAHDPKVDFYDFKYSLMLLKILMGQTYLQETYLSALKQKGIGRWAAPSAIYHLCETQSEDDPVTPEIKEFAKQIFLAKRGFKRPANQTMQIQTYGELALLAKKAWIQSIPATIP